MHEDTKDFFFEKIRKTKFFVFPCLPTRQVRAFEPLWQKNSGKAHTTLPPPKAVAF